MKLGIQKKVVISFVIVGVLPLLVGLYLTYLDGKTSRRNSIGASFQEMAKETADKIDMVIGREVIDTQRLALSPNIRRAIKSKKSDPELTGYLAEFRNYDENAVHSLLVVDSGGRFVAGVNESDRGDYHVENWFTGAYDKGKGGEVYVGDLKREGDTDVYLMTIAAPVMDGGVAIGLLVIRYSVDKLLSVINNVRMEETGHANLVDSSGTIIMCPIYPLRSHQVSAGLMATISKPEPGWVVAEDDAHGAHGAIVGFAPVRSTLMSGNGWFDGKKWYIFIRQSPEEVYTPIYTLLVRISLFGVALIALLSFMGVYAARKIVRPIDELYKGVEHFEQGDFGYRLAIHTNDEIEKLANEFNRMAGILEETYSNLQDRTKELETSEERYKDLIENSPEMIHSVNANRFFLNVNKTELDTVGYTLDEMRRMRIEEIAPEEFKETMREHIAQAVDKGISTVESQFITKDGRRIDVEITATAFYDPTSGAFVRTRAFVRDITERKKLETAIRESEEKYKTLFDSLTDSLFMLDTEGRVLAVNRKQEEVLGYLRDAIRGGDFPSILV
ncbi:MAG: PAS domain S-box protein, partial [Nitrospirota bacterium]|nr:PAS domain S-box protein [Nitrospirota bacterium]